MVGTVCLWCECQATVRVVAGWRICCPTPRSDDFCRQSAIALARTLQSTVGADKMAPVTAQSHFHWLHYARF